MKFKIINKQNQKGTVLRTYGNAVIISKKTMQITSCIIAALPLFTSWLYLIIPTMKDVKIRW